MKRFTTVCRPLASVTRLGRFLLVRCGIGRHATRPWIAKAAAPLVATLLIAAPVGRAETVTEGWRETWAVGSMAGFAPYNHTVDGTYTGLDVEILNEAAQSINVALNHRPLPWNRALLDFEMGNLDAVFQLAPSPERFKRFHMVGPLRTTRTVFMTRIDSSLQDFAELDELSDLVVGIVAGFSYEDSFDTDESILKEPSEDDFTNMRKLLLGRVDVIVGGYASLAYVARALEAEDQVRFLPTPLVEQARYIAFPRDQRGAAQAERLQKALDAMHGSGRVASIVEGYVN